MINNKNTNTYNDEKEDSDIFYSKSNMEHIKRGIEALNNGKGKEHDIIEVEEE